MVLEKAKTDGVLPTIDAVRNKLDQPLALGYCNVGKVIESSNEHFSVGDRVVSNGKHAEIVSVPKNLCAKIPDNVTDEAATFTVLAAIGLQGIRLTKPTLGEAVVVIGLGLIGLLTVQMLRAHGCKVLGVDFDKSRLELAKSFGAEVCDASDGDAIIRHADVFSKNVGVDAVIITATTRSNDPISQAAKICRKRGRIVLVGVVGLELNRADFYDKELTFQVSCSYGPGRYDVNYEAKGHDYPVGFVRWTEQRNFEAVLDLMSDGSLDVSSLISHRFSIENGVDAMDLLVSNTSVLGIILNYTDETVGHTRNQEIPLYKDKSSKFTKNTGTIGFVGAGNYAGSTLIPAFERTQAKLKTIVSAGGVSAVHNGKKHGFENATTDFNNVLNDQEIDTVVITTQHNLHADQVLKSLQAGKNVFCEKPLCLNLTELNHIESEIDKKPDQHLMVGYNRRFSPYVMKMKELVNKLEEPKSIIITVNAGEISSDHWTQDPRVGGGRILGECCHFIDLARHLAGAKIISHNFVTLGNHGTQQVDDDKISIILSFSDGSFATIHYLANGSKGYPKERVEVFVAGKILQLNNFRSMKGWGWSNFSSMKSWRQDKGQIGCANAFVNSLQNDGEPLIPKDEIIEVARVTIEIAEAARHQ